MDVVHVIINVYTIHVCFEWQQSGFILFIIVLMHVHVLSLKFFF